MSKKEYFILEESPSGEGPLFYAPLKDYCALIDDTKIELTINRHIENISKLEDIQMPSIHQRPPNLFLALTNQCNLKCKYCYAGPTDFKESRTTKSILKNAIDAYFINIKERHLDHCTIGFMGGREPTCAFDLMKYAIGYADKVAQTSQIKITYTMVTNGFYNHEISNFICKHFNQLSLSFDGPAVIQNYQRPSQVETESYERVFKNAIALKFSKVAWQIHVVVTSYNINHLDETMSFFNEHFPDIKVVFALMDKENKTLPIDPPNSKDFHNSMEVLQKKYQNVEITADRNLNSFKTNACISVANQDWYISVNGIIETCMRASHSKKNIFSIGYFDFREESFILIQDKIESLKRFDIERQADCKICFAKYLCGGGCPYLRNSGEWNCYLTRLYAKESIIKNFHEKELKKHLSQLFLL